MKDNKYNYNDQKGLYRHRIGVYTTELKEDELLQDKEVDVLFARYWAMEQNNRNINQLENDKQATESQKRFVFRYAKSLDDFIRQHDTQFKLEYKGVFYRVKEAFNNNDLNEKITIYVESVV